MFLHVHLVLTVLLASATATSNLGGRAAAVEAAGSEEDEVCLFQSRHKLGTRRADGSASDLERGEEDVMSLFQSLEQDGVDGQAVDSDSVATQDVISKAGRSEGETFAIEGASNEAASSEAADTDAAAASSGEGANVESAISEDERLGFEEEGRGDASESASIESARIEGERLGVQVAQSEAVSREVVGGEYARAELLISEDDHLSAEDKTSGEASESASIEAARVEGERLGVEFAQNEAVSSRVLSGEDAHSEASRSEGEHLDAKDDTRRDTRENASVEVASVEGERIGSEVADSETASSKAKGRVAAVEADYIRMQHDAGSLTQLARSSALGYQTASAAMGDKAIGFLVVIIGLSFGVMIHEHASPHDEKGMEKCGPEPLEEDAYGLAIESLVHNTALIASGTGSKSHWLSRLALTQGILFMNMALQMYLLQLILRLCASVSVHNIREAYDNYEFHMYGRQESHTFLTANGKHRGLGEFFDPRNFATLPEDLKHSVCNIPFSQPVFFIVVIFIWTLVCVKEIKTVCDTYRALIVNTERCDSMSQALCPKPDSEGPMESPRQTICQDQPTRRISQLSIAVSTSPTGARQEILIHKITRPIKAYIYLFILLPRLVITLILCYIGCRWLAATNNFTDLVLNAVALEFIMGLKDLLYVSLVPNRNKRDLQNTWTHPPYRHEPANFSHFLGTFVWFFIAVLWSCVYTFHVQRVLPQYNWDVRTICEQWLLEASKT